MLLGCPCIFSTGNLENDLDQDEIKPGEITPSWEAIIYEESPWRIVILQGRLGFLAINRILILALLFFNDQPNLLLKLDSLIF